MKSCCFVFLLPVSLPCRCVSDDSSGALWETAFTSFFFSCSINHEHRKSALWWWNGPINEGSLLQTDQFCRSGYEVHVRKGCKYVKIFMYNGNIENQYCIREEVSWVQLVCFSCGLVHHANNDALEVKTLLLRCDVAWDSGQKSGFTFVSHSRLLVMADQHPFTHTHHPIRGWLLHLLSRSRPFN